MLTLHGIANCDKVRAARRYLDTHGIDYSFVDLREQPPSLAQWQRWLATLGTELINRRSTTWKQLDPAQRAQLDSAHAAEVLSAHPTLMKRPLLALGNDYHVGFTERDYDALFERHRL
jgi:arsenate reductase (glutaredoxin)